MLYFLDYEVSKETFERKLSKRNCISKAMAASGKQPEEEPSLLENEKRILDKSDQELTRTYCKNRTAVRKSTGKLVEIVATRFVEMAMCISRAFARSVLREIPELPFFSEEMSPNRRGHSEQR